MPTAAERLSRIRLKIERAKKHIREFEQRLEAFRLRNPYGFMREDDPNTGERIYKVRVSEEPPVEDLALIAGDAIHQTRSALDHLAWQLVEANGRKRSAAPDVAHALAG